MPHLPIDSLDTDGAIREAEEAVAGDTRAQFFRKAAIGGGTVLGSSALLGMLPASAPANDGARPSAKQDLAILNYALTLEYLEAAFYSEASASGALSGDFQAYAVLLAEHENTHAGVLKATIKTFGGTPVEKPAFDFKGTTQDPGAFINTSLALENTGVHAYLGQATNLKSKLLLAVASTIVTVEARHAAAAATLVGQAPYEDKAETSITPDSSFDVPFGMDRVLQIVGDTGFIVG